VPLATFSGHGDTRGKDVTNKSTVIDLAHDGHQTLLSCGWDNTVRVWPGRAPGAPVPGSGAGDEAVLMHEQAVLALTLLTDGRLCTGAGDGTMALWARDEGGGAYTEKGTCRVNTPVRGLAPLPDGGFGQVARDARTSLLTIPTRAAPC
jgi:WD40 repeat protein